jgi:hypothetical protein
MKRNVVLRKERISKNKSLTTEYVCKEILLREWITVRFVPLSWDGHGEVQTAPNWCDLPTITYSVFVCKDSKPDGDLSHF